MPRRLVPTTDPAIVRVFKKFRQQGKTPEKAINLARRFVALQEIKARTLFNSAETAALIRLGFFHESHKVPFGNNRSGPVAAFGPVQRAINELKRNDPETQRQIINIAVHEIIAHGTPIGVMTRSGDFRQTIDEMIGKMSRRAFKKTIEEIVRQRFPGFNKKPPAVQERIMQEIRGNIRAEIGFRFVQGAIEKSLALTQREVKMLNAIGAHTYFTRHEAPHQKVSPQAAEQWAQYTIANLNHLRFLQNALANPQNAAHARREIAKQWE